MASILYLHTVPDCGGDTLFASQYAAYDALSPRMKAYLEGMTATHSGDHIYRRNNALMGIPETGKVYPKASHPIVRTHPVTKTQGAVRQRRIHHPYRRAAGRGESRDPGFSLRVQHAGGIPGAVPLATPFGRILGQPQRPASSALGLLPSDALRPPGDDQRRSAVLISLTVIGATGHPAAQTTRKKSPRLRSSTHKGHHEDRQGRMSFRSIPAGGRISFSCGSRPMPAWSDGARPIASTIAIAPSPLRSRSSAAISSVAIPSTSAISCRSHSTTMRNAAARWSSIARPPASSRRCGTLSARSRSSRSTICSAVRAVRACASTRTAGATRCRSRRTTRAPRKPCSSADSPR